MTTLSLLAGLALGPVVGLAATLAMDPVMARLPEGTTAPKVAAGVLTDTPVDDAPERLATWVHYVAGAGSGLLFVGLVSAIQAALGLGVGVALAVAGVAQFALMVGFFALVPLPRAPGLPRQRLGPIRRDWAASAAAYVLVAAVAVGVATAV
ncbi:MULTISPECIES: hypothetical protein [Halorubrum]|jgi:hypothetical protein|uniref:DUF2938 domain-containing protein n=1 Tax=Halorubrum tropicale TaxID=1765655 RepID=A0A0M9AQU0_9EURY|nr:MULTISPECIES: hypothetical protein [Halorubrum]KOX95591.1 hypothetical protein AMR74_13880 [Halorubrum tropicale]RLM49807.1 hypothetical protein DVK06_13600 [Halorubrum sp. Atlit-28R]TKX45088.1 hypothetical protein EXE50_03705 [Halorubrum sp. ARQ200]TKX48766.1 hypothetical protein EXE49_14885 [Halorubrum sp. ASP121]TKX58616.1 hypothetical protein EXE48_15965 [Halorubrum sp. ASP1]